MNQLQNIHNLLKQDHRLVSKNGDLLKNKIFELSQQLDAQLLKLLCSDEVVKRRFFKDIEGMLIFDKVAFQQLIDSDGFLPNSYTKFKNGLILSDENGNAIKASNQVVLEFPGKDCILEMDSTSDKEEREEIFFNEILAADEIDQLLAPKVFNHLKKHTASKGESMENINPNDNLIIKGNNLLALHSLLPKYAGEVKCMYWDILYNTENDEVPYNDSFKHSSWLTMMKNRLEVARELLKDTGCIFIHLDDTELAYLKVLCDELFGRENFITMITCKVKAPSGVAAGSKMFFDVSEYILCYAKDKKLLNFNTVKVETEVVSTISKTASQYKYLLESVDFSKKEQISTIGDVSVFKIPKEYISISQIDTKKAENSFFFENIENIFATASLSGGTEKKVKSFLDSLDDYDSESLYSYTLTPKKGKNKGSLVENLIFKKRGMLFLKDYSVLDSNKKEVIKLDYLTNIISNDLWQGIASEGSVTLKNGKKPENLIKTLLEVATNEGDLVLDAYLGSGTTAAVAHKMGRRYIGIEQLEDHFKMAEQRLSRVIEGDATGISKSLNWKGGGSFISCELASNSSMMIDRILQAKDDELLDLYQELQDSPFLSYRVDLLEMKQRQTEFKDLSLMKQRQLLIQLVEKNTLYVNYSEMEDASYGFDEQTKQFNDEFYQNK